MRKTSWPSELADVMQAPYIAIAAIKYAAKNAHRLRLGADPPQPAY
jgi:hypothetical protein